MQFVEPYNLDKRLDELRHQLQRKQLASHATATEIAFHLRGSPRAAAFEAVLEAIMHLDFAAALAAIDAMGQGASVSQRLRQVRHDRTPETSLS